MMIILGVALLIQAAEPADPPSFQDRYLILREHVETFEVPGRNYRAFYRNVDDYGPNGRFSWFEFHLEYGAAMEVRGEVCRASSETVSADLIYRLPAWTEYERRNNRERDAFDAMIADQRTFLDVYAEIVRRGGYGLLQDMRSLEDMACDELRASLQVVGEAWREAIEEVMERHEDRAGTVPLADTVCRTIGTRIRRCRD